MVAGGGVWSNACRMAGSRGSSRLNAPTSSRTSWREDIGTNGDGLSTSFTAYDRNGFDEWDQEGLRDVFGELARQGVHVVLSNSDTPLVRRLFADAGLSASSRSARSTGGRTGGGRWRR